MSTPTSVIVTGAAGNLGSAVAEVLAARGHPLVLVDRTREGLEATAARLPADADILLLPDVDLTDAAAAKAMAGAAIDRFGGIGGLVNTVGGFRMGSVIDGALDQWTLMMQLNAVVPLNTSAAVLPAMKAARFGRIVHVAAAPGLKAGANQAAYAASKAAVLRLTESIAEEHRKDGITANCILPGTIDTPQNRASMPDARTDTWVFPTAIARLIAFLVSEEAGVVTGGAIPATGRG
jgi:NAD(P)-dependent dehydrogenase (short-subunit alcohol dehydrogenase family)